MKRTIFQKAKFLLAAHTPEQWPQDGRPEIVLLGRSNVGKSSLINSLTGRKQLARTAQTPGKTRQVNYYDISGVFYLCDLPGYGFAKGRKGRTSDQEFRQMTDAYLTPDRPFARVLLLLDQRHKPTELDRQMLAWIMHYELPLTIVLMKGDKLSRQKQKEQINKLLKILPAYDDLAVFAVSNVTKEGIRELQDHIIEAVEAHL